MGTSPVAITPAGVAAGDPAVLAELCARRGPAVLGFVDAVCDPAYRVRAAADAFARFRGAVADGAVDVHPDALLLRSTRLATLELSPPGPDLGCAPARGLLAARAERTIEPGDEALLSHHLGACGFCHDLAGRLENAETLYREADEAPVPRDAASAIVAAMAAAAPVRPLTAEQPSNGHAASREPTSEAVHRAPAPDPIRAARLVAEPEPLADEPEEEPLAAEPEPEPLAGEPEPEEEPLAHEPEPEPLAAEPQPEATPLLPPGVPRRTAVKPYYELPSPTPRRRQRSLRAAERAGAAAGAAAAIGRRAGSTARRLLERPTPPAAPVVPAEESPNPPHPDPDPWGDMDEITFPTQEPEHPEPEAEIADEPLPVSLDEQQTASFDRLRRRRRRSREPAAPPRLPRARRERVHRPLTHHDPRDLAIPGGLLVIAVLVILAVAGVFSGGSTTPAARPQIRAAAPVRPHTAQVAPAGSATAISLQRAVAIVGGPAVVGSGSSLPPATASP